MPKSQKELIVPKLKETVQIDRFRIIAEMDQSFVGPVLGMLARMGIEHVSYELMTDVRTFHNNKAPADGPKAIDFALEFAEKARAFTSREIVAHFKEAGRAASGAYWGIRALTDRNLIQRMADGSYALTPKQLMPPRPEAASEAASTEEKNGTKVASLATAGNKEAIIAFIANRGKGQRVTTKELKEMFKEQKRNPNSVAERLNLLVREKRLKSSNERGSYIVL